MTMDLCFSFLLFSTTSLLLAALSPSSATNDTAALSLFRSQTDLHGALLSNWTTAAASTACTANWVGVNCTNNRVTAVSLPSLNLRGPIDALSSLDQLRFLDLRGNRLNGTLAPITQCLNLKLIYLSDNDFSGEIPPELSSLHRLLRLDLSNNNLHGPIPTRLSNLSRLLTLQLQNNELSGTIPDFLGSLPQLKELNLSNNELYGLLPKSLLSRYGGSSFSGNEGLCGNSPFTNCTNAGVRQPSSSSQTVPSNPSSLPSSSTASTEEPPNKHRKKLSNGAIVAIVVVNSVLLLVIASFMVAYCCGKNSRDTSSMAESEGGKRSSHSSEKRVYANNGGGDSDGTNATDKSKLVFFDRKKQFELEDLLRASAEMLGKGSLGTVYKAVLDDGSTVAVKRLKDANPCARKEFEQYMDVVGKLKHPNQRTRKNPVGLDYKNQLGTRCCSRLARIHEEYAGSRIPHGNVKSSNVLLDKNGIACISDFGLSLLLNPVHAIARLGGYRAPEQTEIKRLSQKADVYSFGVVLLEVLTGRSTSYYPSSGGRRAEEEEQAVDLPKWVRSVVRDEWTAEVFDQELLRYKNIEEELVSMLHVAMACVVPQPEKRPTMGEVVRMIEEIRVEQSPLGEEYYDESRNSLSPSMTTTEDGLA
ncbi:UNVERIFIED_CONTAM: Leucine-rich repeat receptor-like protein kinase PXC1 [Sesamum angustifolium]|uniref:Leucine-rich repeat receptor-like protein kinase PXC1 n=1 Tax=Sesamum angustifolium TaxID=2727405 RepID=A0AAW2MTR6_9LAMI